MNTLLAVALLAASFPQAPPLVKPINATGVAASCTDRSTCTYTDLMVTPGPHFYFIVAQNAVGNSGPSNRVDVVVPAGVHSVVLTWDSSGPNVTYYIYRGAPPTAPNAKPQ